MLPVIASAHAYIVGGTLVLIFRAEISDAVLIQAFLQMQIAYYYSISAIVTCFAACFLFFTLKLNLGSIEMHVLIINI